MEEGRSIAGRGRLESRGLFISTAARMDRRGGNWTGSGCPVDLSALGPAQGGSASRAAGDRQTKRAGEGSAGSRAWRCEACSIVCESGTADEDKCALAHTCPLPPSEGMSLPPSIPPSKYWYRDVGCCNCWWRGEHERAKFEQKACGQCKARRASRLTGEKNLGANLGKRPVPSDRATAEVWPPTSSGARHDILPKGLPPGWRWGIDCATGRKFYYTKVKEADSPGQIRQSDSGIKQWDEPSSPAPGWE